METSILRILDANANRLREGLRVIEEVARFCLDSRRLAATLKRQRRLLRQALARMEKAFGGALAMALLGARDAAEDVGRGADGLGRRRGGLPDLLAANFKRVQEAARVLEEYSATLDGGASALFEQIRYAAYDLEAEMLPGLWRVSRLEPIHMMVLVTEPVARQGLPATVRAAIRGGADMIQYRNKELEDSEFTTRARHLLGICRRAGVPFVVNDRVDVAAAIDADGVHLGPDDMSPGAARKVLGAERMIGVSASTLAQARAAQRGGADYIGAGAVFPTPTKKATGGRAARTRGLDFLGMVCQRMALPVFAIGGVSLDTVERVAQAGCGRVAVCSAAVDVPDVESAVRKIRRRLLRARRLP